MDDRSTTRADRVLSTLSSVLSAGALIALAVIFVVALTSGGSPTGSDEDAASGTGDARAEKPRRADAARTEAGPAPAAELVASHTGSTLPRAPQDDQPLEPTDGDVVHPRRTLPVHAEPGGRRFATIAPEQMGDTWLPVIGRRGDWTQVLLPSRPNGSTGWLRTADLEQARTPYLVRVHVGSRRLDLFREDELVGSWSVAVGAPETPTPLGRTFLLGSIVDPEQDYSPLILPLGSHSDTLDSYGGGPGTVALHGWPDASVFGTAVSHGCVRVPADALEQLRQVPLGTLVIVDQH